MESYTPTRLDFRSSLIKSHNSLFYSIQYRTSFHFLPFRAYRLGQRRGQRGNLFIYLRSTREEGNVDNAACNEGGGISMVHQCGLKNLLMVKMNLTTG